MLIVCHHYKKESLSIFCVHFLLPNVAMAPITSCTCVTGCVLLPRLMHVCYSCILVNKHYLATSWLTVNIAEQFSTVGMCGRLMDLALITGTCKHFKDGSEANEVFFFVVSFFLFMCRDDNEDRQFMYHLPFVNVDYCETRN